MRIDCHFSATSDALFTRLIEPLWLVSFNRHVINYGTSSLPEGTAVAGRAVVSG